MRTLSHPDPNNSLPTRTTHRTFLQLLQSIQPSISTPLPPHARPLPSQRQPSPPLPDSPPRNRHKIQPDLHPSHNLSYPRPYNPRRTSFSSSLKNSLPNPLLPLPSTHLKPTHRMSKPAPLHLSPLVPSPHHLPQHPYPALRNQDLQH